MPVLRDSRVIVAAVIVAVCALGVASLVHLKDGVRDRLEAEFGLTGDAAEFAFQCHVSGEPIFGIRDTTRLWGFCGCLASDMAATLEREELASAANRFGQIGLDGIDIPTVTRARTPAERRLAEALRQGTLACRSHLYPPS